MKLKFTYKPKKDSNGYYLFLPNGNKKEFKTKRSFDRWFIDATKELNGVLKVLILHYPVFSEMYSSLFIRSNINNPRRLTFIQSTYNETLSLVGIMGRMPLVGFYEAYTHMYRLLSFYRGFLDVYYTEFSVFSDRHTLSRIHLIQDILQVQKFKLDNL